VPLTKNLPYRLLKIYRTTYLKYSFETLEPPQVYSIFVMTLKSQNDLKVLLKSTKLLPIFFWSGCSTPTGEP